MEVVKLVCDGSISERTARLSQPYIGRPSDYGILVTEEGALYAAARQAHEAGWQIGTHADGDVAIIRRCGFTSACSASYRAAIRASVWSTARWTPSSNTLKN